eukprot:Skav204758  [mRNA]  locus=scaffold1013:254196:261507:+ [translate_table: standard]
MGANKVAAISANAVQKSKEAKMKAAMAGGKSRKKKWAKGKVKEKLANLVMFDKATYDKMLKEIPKARLITPSVVSERLKEKGMIAHVGEKSSKQMIYTRKIGGLCVKEESDVFVEAFSYICRLVNIIRPKKILYMAIDGCAPRAKMNQQRTEFMAKLTEHLRFFICKKIQEDPAWQRFTVVLSGPETPGEYLDTEFKPHGVVKFEYNLERIIDDFILFCMLVGNDFLPCLPFAEIGENGLDDLFRIYKDHLASASSSPWLTKNCGEVDFKQLAKFVKKYGELEDGHLQAACDEENFMLGKQRLVGPADAPTPQEYTPDLPIEPPPTADLAREQWYDVKFGMDLTKYEGVQTLGN